MLQGLWQLTPSFLLAGLGWHPAFMRSASKADPPELLRGSALSAAGEVLAGKAESLAALVPDMSSTATWHQSCSIS